MDESTIRLRWEAIETKSAAVMLSSSVMVSSVSSVVEPEVGDQDLIAMSEVFGLEQLANFTDTQRDTVKEATEEAKKVAAARCRLVDGTEGESFLFMALRDSAISRIQGGRDGYLVIVYDLKSSGEDPKDPLQRSAPLRKAHVDRLTGVALRARSTVAGEINPGDMWILFDDGRPSLMLQLQGSLKMCPKTVKRLHVVYSEDGLNCRSKSLSAVRQARSGYMNLRQVEGVHFISAGNSAQL